MHKIIKTTAALALIAISSCNKDPYVPNTSAVYVELGNGDATYGKDNNEQPKLTSLKYMTYNIHAANPPAAPGTVDLAAIAKVITDANPDIVFLQEVDNKTGRNGYSGDMAADLGQRTKMNAVFFSAISYSRGFYGVAILSKYPLKGIKKYMLPKADQSEEQRVFGQAIVDLPGVDSLVASVAHLQQTTGAARLVQIKEIARIVGDIKIPLLFGGDMNEKPEAVDFFNVFDATFTRTCIGGNCQNTFPASVPTSIIDYLAFRPGNAFSITSHNVINERLASDHLPVLSELKFNR